jgi:hypothetical protein
MLSLGLARSKRPDRDLDILNELPYPVSMLDRHCSRYPDKREVEMEIQVLVAYATKQAWVLTRFPRTASAA